MLEGCLVEDEVVGECCAEEVDYYSEEAVTVSLAMAIPYFFDMVDHLRNWRMVCLVRTAQAAPAVWSGFGWCLGRASARIGVQSRNPVDPLAGGRKQREHLPVVTGNDVRRAIGQLLDDCEAVQHLVRVV